MVDIARCGLMEASLRFLNLPILIPLSLPIPPFVLARFMSGSAEVGSSRTEGRPTLLGNHSLISSSGDVIARPSSP